MAKPENKTDAKVAPFPLTESKANAVASGKGRITRNKFSKDELVEKRIIHPGMKDIDVLNAFRELRTSILPKMRQFNSVLQISAVRPGGGASFNALNLAVSCTFDQHRNALLVDCNFEKPSLAKSLDIDAEAGLYDFLTERLDDISDIVYPTQIPRLSLVPSGNIEDEQHIEFFTGENMRIFLEDVRSRYEDRIIIIDSPPLLESADAKILAEVADYVLLVLPYKRATSGAVNRMIKSVGKEKIVGMIINN